MTTPLACGSLCPAMRATVEAHPVVCHVSVVACALNRGSTMASRLLKHVRAVPPPPAPSPPPSCQAGAEPSPSSPHPPLTSEASLSPSPPPSLAPAAACNCSTWTRRECSERGSPAAPLSSAVRSPLPSPMWLSRTSPWPTARWDRAAAAAAAATEAFPLCWLLERVAGGGRQPPH